MATGINLYIGSGPVAVHTFKENVNTKNGPMSICDLMVPVKTWKPGRNGAEGVENTMWYKMTAFGKQADYWHSHFDKGVWVGFQGNPELEIYKKDDDIRVTTLLNNPSVNLLSPQQKAQTETVADKDPFFG